MYFVQPGMIPGNYFTKEYEVLVEKIPGHLRRSSWRKTQVLEADRPDHRHCHNDVPHTNCVTLGKHVTSLSLSLLTFQAEIIILTF